uniref:CP/V1 n=1 Tax=Grapevine geminivirus A TaxID=1906317 RepID=A0A1L5YAJ5_9GEMI|nr:CP/V1 [Grapevine geminivirus A]AQN80507.1 CP/V1 [Grapevine geminivirus A]
MDFNPRKRKSFAPLTPAQLARQRRWRALVAQGAKRRLTYPSLYRPQLMNVRRSSQSVYPDKGYHDDEDHWEGFTMSEGKATYVSMPHLGQGASQRHTSKIKLWSISVRGSLHVLNCSNPETISAQVILVWAHRPEGGSVPGFYDLFTGGGSMNDQHNPTCAKLKHSMTKSYHVLSRRTFQLTPYTTYSSGRNRVNFQIYKVFRGRNTKYVTFGEDSTGGSYSDIKYGGLFYFIRFISSDAGAKLEGDWNCRIIYYH